MHFKIKAKAFVNTGNEILDVKVGDVIKFKNGAKLKIRSEQEIPEKINQKVTYLDGPAMVQFYKTKDNDVFHAEDVKYIVRYIDLPYTD